MTIPRRPLLAGLALLLGPRLAWPHDETVVRGSGRVATETREVGAFVGIDVRGPCDVVLRPASREALSLRGEDNVLPLFQTVVREGPGGRILEIGLKRQVRVLESRTPVVVTLDVVRLESLSLAGTGRVSGGGQQARALAVSLGGVGDIDLAGLRAETLAVDLGGSGNVALDGRAPALRLSIAGSGSVRAEALAADEVAVVIAGSGTARVHAEKTLRVSITGSGNVAYRGDPQLTTSIVGSGHVGRG